MARHKWTVGSNMPGFMPDSEPDTYSSYIAALHMLQHDIQQATEMYIENIAVNTYITPVQLHTERKRLSFELSELTARPRERVSRSMKVGSYVYWLQPI